MEEVTQALKIKTDTEESPEKTQDKQKTGLCLVALPAVAAPVEVVWPLSDESPVAAIQETWKLEDILLVGLITV